MSCLLGRMGLQCSTLWGLLSCDTPHLSVSLVMQQGQVSPYSDCGPGQCLGQVYHQSLLWFAGKSSQCNAAQGALHGGSACMAAFKQHPFV